MNHTIVKIRTRSRDRKYWKLFSDQKLYDLPENLEDTVEFSPDHCLDEDSWFAVKNFSRQDFCIPLLKEEFVSTSYELLEKKQFGDIDYLCYIEEGLFCFQKVSKTGLLKRRAIVFDEAATYRKECREIVIYPEPDAIYLKEKNQLIFKKLSSISSIFRGIDVLYREATEEETSQFLNQDFIELENYSSESVKKANRKRIAMANDLLKAMDKRKKNIIFQSIEDYCPQLVMEEGKFRITSEQDLKLLLYGIDQRFYTTPDGEEKRIANSVIRIE